MQEHVRHIRQVYGDRRDVMLEAWPRIFRTRGTTGHDPQGGLFLWVTLPEEYGHDGAHAQGNRQQSRLCTGYGFYPDGRGKNTFRLNFSNAQPGAN